VRVLCRERCAGTGASQICGAQFARTVFGARLPQDSGACLVQRANRRHDGAAGGFCQEPAAALQRLQRLQRGQCLQGAVLNPDVEWGRLFQAPFIVPCMLMHAGK